MSIKIDRINHMLVKEISYILNQEIKDKDIKFVTVTAVRTTTDLSYAKVYITVLNEKYKVETLKALDHAKGYIKKLLADRVEIRHIPELEFIYDESIEYGNRIEQKIKEIHD